MRKTTKNNFYCHAKTLKELYRHIRCCEIHYNVKIDQTKIIPPQLPTILEWRVDSGISNGPDFVNKCPTVNKGCELLAMMEKKIKGE
jgi:hypothetical protein